MTSNKESNSSPTNLDEMVATTCFSKLRETFNDKNSSQRMRHRNIYAEFMQKKA